MICTHCDGLLNTRLRPGLGIDWLCAWCGQAGTYHTFRGRTVRVVTVPGKAEHRKRWVPAESMTYLERVASHGGTA